MKNLEFLLLLLFLSMVTNCSKSKLFNFSLKYMKYKGKYMKYMSITKMLPLMQKRAQILSSQPDKGSQLNTPTLPAHASRNSVVQPPRGPLIEPHGAHCAVFGVFHSTSCFA